MAKRNISGILLLDKPEGITSSMALVRIRAMFKAQKGGHTGALDPLASGLLPICLGEAAKFSSFFLEGNKRYIAEGTLGKVTTTCDREGDVVMEREVGDASSRLEEVLPKFVGVITQIPPIYSAVKVAGKPLYQYARQGKEVEIPKREIEVYEIKLLEKTDTTFKIEVYCSKGTYIRTLIADIGEALGCGAYVSHLRRTFVEGLPEEMIPIDEVQHMVDIREDKNDFSTLDALLLPLELALVNLPKVDLPIHMAKPLTRGVRQGPKFEGAILPPEGTNTVGPVQVCCRDRFLGVCEFKQGILVPKRMMAPELMVEILKDVGA